ncbi:MAG: RNA polymerase subunit sigma [Oscillospiraceae bacterium]|nr:RNA polymerase subunit sigma [Oscillospiraceae bacterium]
MNPQLNEKAIAAKQNAELRNSFLTENELFIVNCAQKTAKRYIDKSDDEFSIALIAFNRAIDGYSPEKGDFAPFAKTVIKNGLLDHFKSQNRFSNELSVSPNAFDGDVEQDCEETSIQLAVSQKAVVMVEHTLKEEIEAVGELLSQYGISFFDLAECSPKSEKTRKCCATAVNCVVDNDSVFEKMRKTLLLPIKMIISLTKLPRKLLERHRKYIIAASEILAGDFPALSEYLRYIRKEGKM